MTDPKKVGRPVGPKGGYDRRIAVYLSAEEEINLNIIQNGIGLTGGSITEAVRWAINKAAKAFNLEKKKLDELETMKYEYEKYKHLMTDYERGAVQRSIEAQQKEIDGYLKQL